MIAEEQMPDGNDAPNSTGLVTASGRYIARDIGHAIAQGVAGNAALWDALVSALLQSKTLDPSALVGHIAAAHKAIPVAQSGPIATSILHSAVVALAATAEGGIDAVPQWVKDIIADLDQHMNMEGN